MAASSGGKGGGHVPQGVDGRRQAPNRGLPQLQEAVGGGDHRSMVSPMSKSKEELEVHQQQVQQVVQGDERRYKSTTSTSHYRS
uniref:Uncharacterized protein n=1 Tax=Aegilops tauschii TaxID=37682 RepID=M8CG14_AEGTA